MNSDSSSLNTKGFVIVIVYLTICGLASAYLGMAFFLYAFLPSCITYVFYKNEDKKFKYITLIILAISFVLNSFQGRSSIIFYLIAGFSAYPIINKNKNEHLISFGKIIVIMLISILILLSVSKAILPNENVLSNINTIITNENIRSEISNIISQNPNLEQIDMTEFDQNDLKTMFISSISLVVLNALAIVGAINFAISIRIMKKRDAEIKKIKKIYNMALPKIINIITIILLFIAYANSSRLGDFGVGILVLFFGFTVEIFTIQGIFLLSFLLNKSNMNYKLHVFVLITLSIFISITTIGSFLLVNAGFIDSIFDIRRISRRKNEKK